MATIKNHSPYTEVRGIKLYTMLHSLLMPWVTTPLRHIIISRWSRDGDDANAAEQLTKTLPSHRKDVVAVEVLAATVPDDAWNTPEGRAAYGIFEICLRDVTPYRYGEDPAGNQVIGYAIVVRDTLVFRVSSSGHKTLQKDDGEQLNPYSQSVIELMKFATAHSANEAQICLRLSDDRMRKGRHVTELARIDSWIDRLRVRVFYGEKELDRAGFGALIESLGNHEAATNRDHMVESLIKGLLGATQKGYIPSSVLNLPPYLCHVEDPNAVGFDRRLRDGANLVVGWDVGVFPALWEYTAAFARGAGRRELTAILRKHRVPTAQKIAPSGSKARYSPLRDTTFDKLNLEDASVRASRWLIYSDRPYRPVSADAPDAQRAKQELSNELAVRKVTMLQTGSYLYAYSNPTETADAIGVFEVTRTGPLDAGVIKATVAMAWPDKRKVVMGDDGIPVVTDELERDEHDNPVPWEHCGCDPEVLAQCVERIQRTGIEGSSRKNNSPAANGMVRLLDINRWTTPSDGQALQWEMWCRGNATNGAKESSVGHWRTRWLVWRPAPDQSDPASGLNLG